MFWIWSGFVLFILFLLALDLGVFNRKAHVISVREALKWSTLWVTLGVSFTAVVYFGYANHWQGLGLAAGGAVAVDPVDGVPLEGRTAAIKYITGYVIELSLSVDNIFVIAIIIGYFKVPAIYQHRVLFWGILGALVMRGAMIGVGSVLIARFHWIIYVFGGFLILTALRMLFMHSGGDEDPGKNIVVRWTRKLFPVTDNFHGPHFWVRSGSEESRKAAVPAGGQDEPAVPVPAGEAGDAGTPKLDYAVDRYKAGTLMLTPLAVALIVIEATDLVFAVDSIPAIFAITGDPFIVFASNVFAILGLRSMYFALAGLIDSFRYLKTALAVVLLVVGVKMLTAKWLKETIGEHFNLYLLGVVFLILATGVVASILANRRDERAGRPTGPAAG